MRQSRETLWHRAFRYAFLFLCIFIYQALSPDALYSQEETGIRPGKTNLSAQASEITNTPADKKPGKESNEDTVPGEEESQRQAKAPKKSSTVWVETEWDAYYTSVGFYWGVRGDEPPDLGEKKEREVYSYLLKSSFIPSFVVLEVSTYPMPLVGLATKAWVPDMYDAAQITDKMNIIKSVTSGFQEPYAISLFLGNIVFFKEPGKEERLMGNMGMMGFLFSYSNYHILRNELIEDDWAEMEWKIKGKRKFPVHSLDWSFRVGARIHSNPYIKDIAYFGARRSRIDYEGRFFSLLQNSGFEYIVDYHIRSGKVIRHYAIVDKKWPIKKNVPIKERAVVSLGIGVVWEAYQKYTGELALDEKKNEWQFLVRPNVQF